MIFAGCDIGSLTAKAVLMNEDKIIASAVIRAQTKPESSAIEVMGEVLSQAGIKDSDLTYRVGTGYGRKKIPNVDHVESEISCHAKGALYSLPSVRTVIDIGGQDAKAIRMDENGNVARYGYNDKCASGTGRFLEVMADALDLSLDEMGSLSDKATESIRISNQCVVFAETEVVSLVNNGYPVPNIIKGLNSALANRVTALARSIQVQPDVVFTGGVAKNAGVAKALEEALDMELKTLDIDPQINGALGAALLAKEIIANQKSA